MLLLILTIFFLSVSAYLPAYSNVDNLYGFEVYDHILTHLNDMIWFYNPEHKDSIKFAPIFYEAAKQINAENINISLARVDTRTQSLLKYSRYSFFKTYRRGLECGMMNATGETKVEDVINLAKRSETAHLSEHPIFRCYAGPWNQRGIRPSSNSIKLNPKILCTLFFTILTIGVRY
ncbi:hypothetical protein SNEBB_005586 [Seison nebaliae]|nr:hypothetical protein SNEBB_005586 [Seison nebaliae]